MIAGCKKLSINRQCSYNSLYVNPLNELSHNRSNSEGGRLISNGDQLGPNPLTFNDNKENAVPNKIQVAEFGGDKENIAVPANGSSSFVTSNQFGNLKSFSTGCRALKPSSLQFCMQINEPEKVFGRSKIWDPSESENSSSLKIWDYSDSEAAPASSWTTLPNKWVYFLLLYRSTMLFLCKFNNYAICLNLLWFVCFQVFIVQTIAYRHRQVHLCHCEGSIPRRNGWGCNVFSLYQCKIFSTWELFRFSHFFFFINLVLSLIFILIIFKLYVMLKLVEFGNVASHHSFSFFLEHDHCLADFLL